MGWHRGTVGAVVVRTLDLHGEAGAGVQRAAAVRMTVRAAVEIFMVPRQRLWEMLVLSQDPLQGCSVAQADLL